MKAFIRSQNIYEGHPNYVVPPLIPLPTEKEFMEMEGIRLKKSKLAFLWVRFVFTLTGLKRFFTHLQSNPESYLLNTDMRSRALFFPVVSASLALRDDPKKQNLIERTISLVKACRSFYSDIQQGRLKQDYWHDLPLEMGQYFNFFSTNLTIEHNVPKIFKSKKDHEILILFKNRFYLLKIEDWQDPNLENRLRLTLEHLLYQGLPPGPPVGRLSAPSARLQYKIFRFLRKNPQNAKNLERLKHVFVTICLEPDLKPTSPEQALLLTHRHFDNRWWFGSLQLVIFGNGKTCAIGNFSTYLDGNVMMRGAAEIQKRAEQFSINFKALNQAAPFALEELSWQVPDRLFTLARKDLQRIKDMQQPATFSIESLGREYFKSRGISAIPTFVIALQMTFKELIDQMVAIHQFVSLAHYRYMDLTTVVVSTPEVKQFVESILKHPEFDQNLYQLFLQAIQSQKEVIKKVREKLGLSDILTLFFLNRSTWQKIWAQTLIFPTLRLFRKLKLITMENRQVLISHPAIYSEVPLVGRPGVRLPYVSYLGLHYQIWPEKIVITYMPGLGLKISNQTITRHLEANLLKLKQLIDAFTFSS